MVCLFVNTSSLVASQYLINPNDKYILLCDKGPFFIELDESAIGGNSVNYLNHFGLRSSIGSTNTFHPGTPQSNPAIEIWDVGLDNYKNYGWIAFEISGTNEVFRIYFITCCSSLPEDVVFAIDEDVSTFPNYPNFNGMTFLFLDDYALNNDAQFVNCKMFFGTDAGIHVGSQVTSLEITSNSILKPFCGVYWDGVFANDQNNYITFANSHIEGAARGFTLSNNVDFFCYENTFFDNYTGIQLDGYTPTGNYLNNAKMQITATNFVFSFTPTYIFHFLSPLQTLNNWHLHTNSSGQYCHIFVNNSTYAQIGIPGNSQGKNFFSGRNSICVLVNESEIAVQNNEFNDVGLAFESLSSNVHFGGATSNGGNTVNDGQISFFNSAQYLGFNAINTFNSFISISNPTNSPIINTSYNGTYLDNNLFYNGFCEIDGGFSNTELIINSNRFIARHNLNQPSLILKNLFAGDNLLVTNNKFETDAIHVSGYYQGDNKFQIVFDNANDVLFSDNYIQWAQSQNYPNYFDFTRNGLFLKNSNNVSVVGNFFYQRQSAISATGNITGLIMQCNHFLHNFNAVNFTNVTAASNFGSQSNPVLNKFEIDPNHIITHIQSLTGSSPQLNSIGYYTPSSVLQGRARQLPNIDYNTTIFYEYLINSQVVCPNLEFSSSGGSNKRDLSERANETVLLYPNPFNDVINIQMDENTSDLYIQIVDVAGVVVKTTHQRLLSNLDRIPAGIYVVEIYQESRLIKREKMIKQ